MPFSRYESVRNSQGGGLKVTDQAQNAGFRRFISSKSVDNFQHSEGEGDRRKLQVFAENRRKPQIGVCNLRSVTLSAAIV